MSGWWGWLLRRAVLTPLMPILLLLACLVWLLVLLGSVPLSPMLAAVRRERPRFRARRISTMAVADLLAQCVCLLGCFSLWLVSGCGLRLTERRSSTPPASCSGSSWERCSGSPGRSLASACWSRNLTGTPRTCCGPPARSRCWCWPATPLRHLAAVAKLHQRGLVRRAQQALRMPHVLPPRPAGTLAAHGAPDTDVLIFTDTGHDEPLDAISAWRALPLTRPLQMAGGEPPPTACPPTD